MSCFVVRPVVSALLLLFAAAAADAQVVTEVKAADDLVIHNVGEVRLLGVEGLGPAPAGAKEIECAESTRKMVYGLIHTKVVRLIADDKVKKEPALAMHRYVYLPDGRMLNTVLLESGCARLAAGYESLQYGSMFKSVADHAQVNKRGLYSAAGAPAVASPPAPAPARPATGITLAAFSRVTLGMSFDDVYAILGTGKEFSRFESGTLNSMSYQWDHPDGIGTIMISFMNGKVQSKHQFGLK